MNNHKCAGLESLHGEPVALKGVKATGTVRGLIFEMLLEQRFCNPGDQSIELIYTFPLPWGAVLLGVEVQLGDRHLSGLVVEKKQAEARYEEAISDGNAAIMLERNHDASYSLNLGNLAPDEDCVITVRFVQTLQFEQRGLRLTVPTVIAPRFGDAVVDGGLQPHQTTTHDLLAEYPFEIEIRIHGEFVQARIASPTHPISVQRSDGVEGEMLTVSLARRGFLDRDFVLVVDQLIHESAAVLAKDCVEPECVVALASFCPRVPMLEATAIAVKILVDCSGSMNGDSIEAAKRSLQEIVRQFSDGDRFSLSRFGDTVSHRSRGLWSSTRVTQLAAERWVSALQADMGGTRMETALSSTFSVAQAVPSDVLLVTDGQISAIDQTIDRARASGHRIFVVGIGSSPAESHLRRLAEATSGACDFVAPGEAVEPAVLRMFVRLRSLRLNDLRVEWPVGIRPRWSSALPVSGFDGDTINVFALLPTVPAGDIRLLCARSPGVEPEEIGRVRFGSAVESADSLPKIAAMQRLRSLAAEHHENAEATACQIAVAYQLVTDRTNFLLVHERADCEKSNDMPVLHKVGQMVPAGWAGTSWAGTSFAGLPAPACWRRDKMIDAPLPASDPNAVNFARPEFLNRQNPIYWMGSEFGAGLTPLGLSELLRNTPEAEWPTTYAALRGIGIPLFVVDWLELCLEGGGGGSIPEEVVVATFVHVISRCEGDLGASGFSRMQEDFNKISKYLISPSDGESKLGRPNLDLELAKGIKSALQGLMPDTWPDIIYSLESDPVRDGIGEIV